MIKNGYLVLAIIYIMLVIMVIVGLIVHFYALLDVQESFISKYMIYSAMFGLIGILLGLIFKAVQQFILNTYNNRRINNLEKCC